MHELTVAVASLPLPPQHSISADAGARRSWLWPFTHAVQSNHGALSFLLSEPTEDGLAERHHLEHACAGAGEVAQLQRSDRARRRSHACTGLAFGSVPPQLPEPHAREARGPPRRPASECQMLGVSNALCRGISLLTAIDLALLSSSHCLKQSSRKRWEFNERSWTITDVSINDGTLNGRPGSCFSRYLW